jgi:hypothetical protein
MVNDEDVSVVEEDLALDRASLMGLKGVCILIQDIEDEAEENGLREKQVYFEVSLKLIKAGIDVIPQRFYEDTPGSAYLYVYVHTLNTDGTNYVYNLGLALSHEVNLIRDPEVTVVASTWRSEELGIVPIGEAWKLLESIDAKVEEFIIDHENANLEE